MKMKLSKLIHAYGFRRTISTSSPLEGKHFKLIVVGGGAGGCSVAARLSKKINPSSIAVLEPSDVHYYQPMWTMVGGGMKTLEQSGRPMKNVLPKKIEWIQEPVATFDPKSDKITSASGKEFTYDFLVIATGLKLKYEAIRGLPEALNTPGVGSNYSPMYVDKTFEALKKFKKGNAIFTFPNTPIKCPGAPQKIVYIADSYLRKHNKRQDARLIYNTSLPVLFGVKHYADALWKIVEKRGIDVNLRHNLVEIIPEKREAVFEKLDQPGQTISYEYDFLHVTPPMYPVDAVKECTELTDANGYVDVNKNTLQHTKFKNIFAIGDCSNCPTSKTAAAVAAQNIVVAENIWSSINGEDLKQGYDGYTSCPLVTSYNTCVLAEFDGFTATPMETFPIFQAKERRSMFYLKKDFMPLLYWWGLLTGHWHGPATFRKLFRFGASK